MFHHEILVQESKYLGKLALLGCATSLQSTSFLASFITSSCWHLLFYDVTPWVRIHMDRFFFHGLGKDMHYSAGKDTGCSLNIVFFPKNCRKFATPPSSALCCYWLYKNCQPIGVTVHSHCVESFEGLLQRCRRGRGCSELWKKKHNFS